MIDAKTSKEFNRLFRGNTGFFVKHQAPFTEENGKLKASWCGFATYNKRNPLPEGSATGDFIPLTPKQYQDHLNGGDGLAVAPLMNTDGKENVCLYAAIDIDVYSTNFTWLVRCLDKAGLKFVAFLSKSGGLHIYFFFAKEEPGEKAVAALNRVVAVFGLSKIYKSGETSKVEVFPKQTKFTPGESNVSCLLLPLYNAVNKDKCRTRMLTPEGKLFGAEKAVLAADKALTSVKEINAALDRLPYSDAPYCIQMILLTGILMENDGRNNFLFSAAIYLKKKREDDFYDELSAMNDRLGVPLEKKDVDSIYKSVTENKYDHYWCSKPPCSDYCDKKACAKREFGPTKTRSLSDGTPYGKLSLVTAAEPYYQWEICARGNGEFQKVRIDSLDCLYNQAEVQKLCWKYLSWAPPPTKKDYWIDIVNGAMEGIENRKIEVPKEMDTSETAQLRRLFIEYLTRYRAHDGQPYMVPLGQVYYADGTYYFDVGGFMKFLNQERFPLRGRNLAAELESYGCVHSEVTYTTRGGTVKSIPCCKKREDDELRAEGAVFEDALENDVKQLQEAEKETGNEDTKF